jgi:hypothetical protein
MADDQNVADGIVKARAAGYSDDEIAAHLADTMPGIKKARDAGYSNGEILAHLAGDSAPSAPKEDPSALKDVAMQFPTGFNEGLANTAGLPVDVLSWGLRKVGLPIPANAFGGSQSIKNGLGYIDANPDNAPAQTTAGQFARAAGNGAASAVVPEGALAAAAPAVSPGLLAAARAMVGNGSTMGRTAIAGVASGLGGEAAGQATQGTAAEPGARMAGAVLAGGAAGAVMAPRQAARALPTIDAVKAAASAGYNSPEVQALRVNGGAVNNLGDNIAQTLEGKGFFREDHGPVFNAVDRLSNAGPSVGFKELDAVRQALGGRAGEIDAFGRPTQTSRAAQNAKTMLDHFVENDMTNPNNVLTGNPVAARVAIANARANAGAAIRAEQVKNGLNNAEIRTDTRNSAMNLQNKIRQTMEKFVVNDGSKMGGYTDAEKAQMTRLVRGSLAMNALRYAGNAMGGSGITVGPYVAFGHPLVPATGFTLKTIANMATKRLANNMSDTLLSRAPLAQPVIAANRAIRASNSLATRSAGTQAALRGLAAVLLNK